MKRGDSRGTANIQTVWHDKDVGVFHEPDKKAHGLEQPLQKLIPAAREMICCWERELRKGIKRMASTLWNSFQQKASSGITSDLIHVPNKRVTI